MKHLLLFLLTCLWLFGYSQTFLPLWQAEQIPNSRGLVRTYEETRQRITRVDKPGVYAFFPSQEENTGTAILICPPGGYAKLTYRLAGFQFAKWLNTLGINAFVLIHRLPTEPDLAKREVAPLQDAQRAIKLIRSRAREWKIDEGKVGVMGASAGGHLAATLGTHSADKSAIGDSLDTFAVSPDFMILISPVITMGVHTHLGSRDNLLGANPSQELVERYSNERHITATTPPAFLVHAQNDQVVSCHNSLLFYEALIREQVVASLHLFPAGGHDIALRNNPGSTNLWTVLCEAWLQEMGWL